MNIEKALRILETPRRIVITTHHKPDGDAVGSSLGLCNYLKLKGHDVKVVVPNDYPDFLHWMPGHEFTVDYEKNTDEATRLLDAAEVLFCLDFNRVHRCEGVAPHVMASKAFRIMLDHHMEPDQFCELQLVDHEASATAEMVYRFIESSGDAKLVDKNVAACLYTGIMTDTASFRFSSMKANTHRIIAALMDTGIENHRIHEHVYDAWSEERIRLLGYCMKDKMKVLHEYNTAIMGLSRQEMNQYRHRTGDTEGLVNIPLSIGNIKLSVFFAERKDEVKISFRAKGDFDARSLAEKHFNGGGHYSAAGGRSSLTLDEAMDHFISILPEYRQALTKP